MKFFVDTENIKEIREAASLGILDGVTTNPSLIAKEGNVDFKEHILKICEILNWEGASVSAEVVATEYDGMIAEGRELAKIHPNVYVKLPMTKAGLQATHTLSKEGIRINHTLHVIESARLGADIATMPFKVMEQLIKHPLTDIGLANFLKDWEKIKQ